MNGILVLAHGSREKATEETFQKVVEMAAGQVKIPVETAYMEFGKPNIAAGLDKLLSRGVDHVRVVPYFLFSGIHIREDIPGELAEYQKGHPNITLEMGETLGADPRIAAVLADRMLGK